jgi:hypothetical protein
MARPTYRTNCPQCGSSYNEDAYVEPDSDDRLCPFCLLSEHDFNPEWFVCNPCPFAIGTEERRAVQMARVQFLMPTHVEGDCEDYDKVKCKGIVSRRRSTRPEWIKRAPRTGTIISHDDYEHGD